jgi:tetratricopeptide (TPR) repeat protein
LDLAIADLNEAIRLTSPNVESFTLRVLGDIYSEKGYWDLAILSYEESLRILPNSSSAREGLERAVLEQRRIRFAQGIAEFTEAIRRNPNNADLHFKRGYAFAFNHILQNASSRPIINPFQEQIFGIFTSPEDWDRAIADFEMALRIMPNHAYARSYLERARNLRHWIQFLEAVCEKKHFYSSFFDNVYICFWVIF